jgi:hypothetical protein
MDSLRDDRLKAAQQIQKLMEGTSVSTVDEQISRKLKERRDEREVAARLALVDAFGEDTYDPGDVITFEKRFPGVTRKVGTSTEGAYTYAAIKAPEGDQWFTTGHDCVMGTTFTWDRLIEFLVTGPYPVKSFVLKAKGGITVPSVTES